MPGSFDLIGMLADLQGQRHSSPDDPLDALAASAALARRRMAAFRPASAEPQEPVVRDQRPGA
ncbi:MAG: hypothetical protein ITG02_04215 [Patulibacter sp.]|nr:hypothetical protein [Patulibacter sp.]